MKIKHVFDLIFSDDNLYEAIQDASKGRRYNKDVLRVQHDIWNVIEQVNTRLISIISFMFMNLKRE